MISSLPGFFNHLRKIDWFLVAVVGIISGFSLTALYYLGLDNNFFYFKKQLLYAAIGFFLMAVASFSDYQIFRNYSLFLLVFYGVAILLLAGVLFAGENIRGTVGWFDFGGFNFAPVELAKLAIVLLLAKYFSLRHVEMYHLRHIVASGIYVGIPALLVLLQPDLGSAIILIAVWAGMVIMSGIRLRHLLILLLIGAILGGIMWVSFLKEYQKNRILTFLSPQKDPLGASYNVRQSVIAIGSGGLWGKGIGKGTQSSLGFLPEGHTDFIFAVIAEQVGFIGVLFLLILFMLLIYRILKTGWQANNNFSRLFCVGLSIILFSQIVINVGMNMGLLPVVGIPLPFLSYGGSAAMINFLGLGILQSIRAHN